MRGFCNDRLFFRAGKSQFVESRGDMKNGNDIFVSLLVYFLLTLVVFELVPLIQREKLTHDATNFSPAIFCKCGQVSAVR